MAVDQREKALEIVRRLREAGHEALFAGGCVRDQLLGRTPKDYDVATSARPDAVRDLFGHKRTLAIGASFGVIGVLTSRGRDPIEVATFRSDGAYLDGRHPSSVRFTTAAEDAQRRDFTINGLFYDPISEQVVDYVDGQADLARGLIRAIGKPEDRFQEDKLRMLRAVRFATVFKFAIEEKTLAAVQEMASEVNAVSAERIGAEIERILTHPQRRGGLELLAASGLLEYLLPELHADALRRSEHWQAMLAVLERLESTELSTALAALFSSPPRVALIRIVGKRLRYPNREIEQAEWMLAHLELVKNADTTPWPTLQRVLIHDGCEQLIRLAEACWGREQAGVALARAKLQLPADVLNPQPLLSGDDLVAGGLEPGKHFAGLLQAVRDAQLLGTVTDRKQAWQLVREIQNTTAPRE